MITLEQVEKLRKRANISYDEAKKLWKKLMEIYFKL